MGGRLLATPDKEESFNMDAHDQATVFYKELVALTDRFKEEFDMTYTQLIGVMETYKLELFCEAMAIVTDDDEGFEEEEEEDEKWLQ